MKNIAKAYLPDEEIEFVPFYAQSVAPADEAVAVSSEEEEYDLFFAAVAASFRAFVKAPTLERARACSEQYSELSDFAKEVYGVRSPSEAVLLVLDEDSRAKYDEYLALILDIDED